MHFALFCQFAPTTACGIVMRGKAEALAALGHPVDLLYHPFKGAEAGDLRETHEGLRILLRASRFFRARSRSRWLHMPGLLADVFAVWKILRRADIVILQKPLPLSALYFLLLRGTGHRGKILCLLDDWEGLGGMAMLRHPARPGLRTALSFLEEWLPAAVDGTLCASRMLWDKYRLTPGLASRLLYHPSGGKSFDADRAPGEAAETAGDFQVGYIGTFKSAQLACFLARAISMVLKAQANVRFTVLGGGEHLETFHRELTPGILGVSLYSPGQVSHAEVLRILPRLDLCMMYISGCFPEAYLDGARSSAKLFEYMAAGKALVVSRAGEPAEVLRDGDTGWLVENRPECFARAVQHAAEHRLETHALGARARADFERRFSHSLLMRDLVDWATALPRR